MLMLTDIFPASHSQLSHECRHAARDAAYKTFRYLDVVVQRAVGGGDRDAYEQAVSQFEHTGAPPMVIDAHAESIMAGVLSQHLGRDIVLTSEESRRVYNDEPGQLHARIDPCDGTSNNADHGIAYGSAVQISMRAADGKSSLLAGAIAANTGLASWSHIAPDSIELLIESMRAPATPDSDDPPPTEAGFARWMTRGQIEPGSPTRVATVATSRRRRARERSLFDFPDVRHAIGGNPILFALLAMNLGSAVETEVVDLHDAIFLIPFKMCGGIVTDLEGEPLDVLAAFSDNTATVGPYIAACSDEALQYVLSCRKPKLRA
jgi:hypothetical protein